MQLNDPLDPTVATAGRFTVGLLPDTTGASSVAPPQRCRIDLALRPTSHTIAAARTTQASRRVPGCGRAVNSAPTNRTPRKPAKLPARLEHHPSAVPGEQRPATGASRFIHGLVVATSQR